MKRPSTEERLQDLLEAAVTVFGRVGYRRAQIADIAREMGVAPGTVYLYVTSKEALFDAALQCALGNPFVREKVELPLPARTTEDILESLREEFARPGFLAMEQLSIADKNVTDVPTEFKSVLSELYAQIYRRRLALKMIEASALDWPELSLFFYGVRDSVLRHLTEYLTIRVGEGRLRAMPAPEAAARLILETIAWFAYHRRSDPLPDSISDETAYTTVMDALVHAYILPEQ